ncbi:hypothetical protein TYRP_016778 [Tyrophagus putrescentiae]|nr:hypothetical protein TYRP_016778 [Tyrophagus putrescentiae]
MHRSGAQEKKEIIALKKRSTRPAPRKFHIFSGSIITTNTKHCIMALPAPARIIFLKVPNSAPSSLTGRQINAAKATSSTHGDRTHTQPQSETFSPSRTPRIPALERTFVPLRSCTTSQQHYLLTTCILSKVNSSTAASQQHIEYISASLKKSTCLPSD